MYLDKLVKRQGAGLRLTLTTVTLGLLFAGGAALQNTNDGRTLEGTEALSGLSEGPEKAFRLANRPPLSAPIMGVKRQVLPQPEIPSGLKLDRLGSDDLVLVLPPLEIVAPKSVADLHSIFERTAFRLADIREGAASVPRIYVTGLPEDLPDLDTVEGRKRVFLRTVLPLVLLANEELRGRRGRLLDLVADERRGRRISTADRAWLDAMAELYEAPQVDLETLLRRVDEIPVSLALAQAIVESGWGTSRFAREGNALFGQRSWSEPKGAMVPRGAEHVRVAAFNDLMSSVRSYMHNLNTHMAYLDLRDLRARQRSKGIAPQGYHLASALNRYAEVEDYGGKLRGLIRGNRLTELEDARLASNSLAKKR